MNCYQADYKQTIVKIRTFNLREKKGDDSMVKYIILCLFKPLILFFLNNKYLGININDKNYIQ